MTMTYELLHAKVINFCQEEKLIMLEMRRTGETISYTLGQHLHSDGNGKWDVKKTLMIDTLSELTTEQLDARLAALRG